MQIYINKLTFGYGIKTVIKNLSLTLNQGDYLVIKGKNGSGKSTFIKCLLGINDVKPGSIFLDETDITAFKKWPKFGYVSQTFDGFNYEFPITVSELLNVSSANNVSVQTRLKLLDQMKIFNIQNQNINSLSGGQLQRVFIVRAMLNNPEVLILDEPTASIDKQNKTFFYETIEALNKQGITIILITHSDSMEHLHYTHVLEMYADSTNNFSTRQHSTEGGDE
ncbi:MAG: ATP-binding cassette domain-containing protein [Tenericutes bacterium]|jgi:zinc transport system ATP-binding protein|nr:ATP-binding cassette domain-containing protein [Mycoplasmatota bacterium]